MCLVEGALLQSQPGLRAGDRAPHGARKGTEAPIQIEPVREAQCLRHCARVERSPVDETRHHKVAVQRCVAARHLRRRALFEADEHDVDGRLRHEVARREVMLDPEREPRSEQRRDERAAWPSEESLRRCALEHEIRDAWRDVRLGESSHEVGGAIERWVREDHVLGMRHRMAKDVGVSHDDVGCGREAGAQARHERRVLLDRDDTCRVACECRGEVPRASAEVVDHIVGADAASLDEPFDERRVAEDVLRAPEVPLMMP
jgi:hypothetical protein